VRFPAQRLSRRIPGLSLDDLLHGRVKRPLFMGLQKLSVLGLREKSTLPSTRAGSTGRRNTLSLKDKVKCMRKGMQFGFIVSEKAEIWVRWNRGESQNEFGRVFGMDSSSIYCQLARTGGIRSVLDRPCRPLLDRTPPRRRRHLRDLSRPRQGLKTLQQLDIGLRVFPRSVGSE